MRVSPLASRVSIKISGVVAAMLFVVLLTPARSEATTIFSTTYAWDGSNSIAPFGNPNTSTYGQTFIAPTDNVLDSFTFYLSGNANLQFVAQVYAWSGPITGSGGGATGPALFTSSTMNLGPTAGAFVPVPVLTGGVTLVAGTAYVALFTISNPVDYAASSGTDSWGALSFGTHVSGNGGGGFVFYNNLNNPGLLNTTAWDTYFDFGDVAWDATFSSVPEPTSLLLLGTGLAFAVRRLRTSRASRS